MSRIAVRGSITMQTTTARWCAPRLGIIHPTKNQLRTYTTLWQTPAFRRRRAIDAFSIQYSRANTYVRTPFVASESYDIMTLLSRRGEIDD
jgi:hypothetical protein